MTLRRSILVWLAAPVILTGCAGGDDEPTLDAASSSARLDAIAAHEDGPASAQIAKLVRSLRSDDPLLRAVAIHELRARTGHTLGFVADDPPGVREAAVERWEQRLEDEARRANTSESGAPPGGATRPTDKTGGTKPDAH